MIAREHDGSLDGRRGILSSGRIGPERRLGYVDIAKSGQTLVLQFGRNGQMEQVDERLPNGRVRVTEIAV